MHNLSFSVTLNPTTLWVVGGYDTDCEHLNSTEFVTLDHPSAVGPELPFTLKGHSMVKFDNNTIFIIGGYQDGEISNKTWIIDANNGFKIRVGPSLNTKRVGHSCGKMVSGGKILLVVAGGRKEEKSFLNSVEILDPTSGHYGYCMDFIQFQVCPTFPTENNWSRSEIYCPKTQI